jgi:hypothetical protein
MSHFPDSDEKPVLALDFEESLIAVSKDVDLAVKICLRCAREI